MNEAQRQGATAADATAARTREQLIAAMDAGAAPKWLMFWGHRAEADGSAGKGSLSQWWPSLFTVDGVAYASAEHWMMARKAVLFGDAESLPKILAAPTPAEAKALGRLVRGFDDARWKAECFEIVVAGNVHKFGQDPALRDFLLGTANRVLVEASPRDVVWGIGLGAANERATDPRQWRGRNLLGFALMEARSRLAAAGRAAGRAAAA
jgi:ribA/ribD-fused uncharacterized protein